MINEEDHIRIQVFASGQELENLLNLAIELDEKIDGLVKYAVNKKYGYLTSCPYKCWDRFKSVCYGTFTSINLNR